MVTMRALVLAFATLTAGVLAGSASDYDNQRITRNEPISQCAISCPGSEGKFSYRPGQTYEFRYNADVQTNIPQATEQSSLHMSAIIMLDVMSQCEMSLRVTNVMLQDSDPTNSDMRQQVDKFHQFKQSLEGRPLRFAFMDGKIESICPSSDEEVWILNIKRGILSAIQNSMTSLQGVTEGREVDVMGSCPVKYTVTDNQATTLKIKKSKNLLGCTERSNAQNIFQSVGYKTDSDIQSAPLLKATHKCDQEIDPQSKIFKKIECVETHIFRPFSRENSGASTQIKYRLVFQRNFPGSQGNYGQLGPNRLKMLYDHTLSNSEMESNVREAQQAIANLCRQTDPDVRPETPSIFAQLVKQMKGLDARNLRQLQTSSQSTCAKAKQFYRDAITVLATPASVSIIRELITSNQVSHIEAELLLTSISFIQNPTTEMMRELKALLQSDLTRASLPVSSVINTFYKQNPSENPEVAAILKIFEDQLRYNCRGNGAEDKAKMLLALRAIGNAGNAERLAQTLDRCAANDQAPMSVRVAAINAYRRMPCTVNREQLFRIYSSKELDSELRINAYLMIMQCADHTIISRVHNQLNNEVVNQVGSFVWTHLTNLAQTMNPLKNDIREIISDPHLLQEFDIDKRKFSRNIEFSAFSNYLNMGGSVESNIILSSQSYIPRSAGFNLTVDVFGESMNLMDVGVRAQGMEELLERYLGPGSDVDNALKRDRRAVITDNVIQHIDRQYSVTRDPMELSYYLRIFGNEIKAGDVTDFSMDSVKDGFDMRDILNKLAQQRSIDFTRSFSFLDTSLSVPTGIGMPIKLGVEGTITVGLTANGKLDVRRMFAKPSDFEITGSIRPSTAVEIEGEFGLDAHVTRTRLRVVNRLHSSTLVDGKLTLKNGQVFNFDWNMPQDKIEIFSAESHFYISHRGQDRVQRGQRPVEHKRCTSPEITNKVGLELCGELTYPGQATGAVFPLGGPASVKVYLNKKDTFTSARIEASFIRNEMAKVYMAKFSFNTPGSRVDRELTAEFRLDRTNKDLSLNIKSPWKKIAVTGQLQSEAQLKRAVLRAMVDESSEYSATAELRTAEQKGNTIKYVPSVRIVWPGRQPVTLEGQLTYVKDRRVTGNVIIKNAFREPITVDGSIQMFNRTRQVKYDANIQFSSPILKGSVVGQATNIIDRTQAWSSRLDVNYQYQNGAKQRIVVNNKIRDTSNPNLHSYSADGSWSTTMWPQYNGKFEFKKAYSSNSLRMLFDAGFDSVRKVTIVQSGAFDVSGVDKKFSGEVKFELPYKRWNYEAKINHIHNTDQLQSNVTVKYDEDREHTFDIGFKKDNTRYLNAMAEARLKMAGREPMTFTNTLVERAPRQYHNMLKIETPGRSLSAIGLYKMGQRHELNADIQTTGYEPISISGHINPNLMNVQAKAELKYGRTNYMTDINWLYRGSPGAFTARGGIELGYQGKKYGISGDLAKVDHNISGSIQAICGFNRRVALTTKISANPAAPEFGVRLDWPQNFINLMASGKVTSDHWARSSEDFEAILKITTGFQGYEELGGSVKLDVGQDSLRTSGQVAWSRNKRITGDFNYARGRAELNVATPFYGYRTIKANGSYNNRGTTYEGQANAEWESNRASLTGRMTHEKGYGWAASNNGEMTLRGPWDGFREAKVTWRHQNDDGTFWKCHHEVEVDRNRKYTLDVDVTSNKVSGRSHDLKAKATFTSPIRDWEQVGVSWESNHDYEAIRSRGIGSVTLRDKTINLEHELNIQPSTFIAKAKVTTPYTGYEVMGIDMNNRLDSRSKSYTLKNEILLGDPQKKVGLEGTLIYSGPTFNTGLRLTTPHPDYPRMAINLRNGRQQDGAWALHGDLEVRRGLAFTLDGKLGFDQKYGAELSMTSPYQSLRSMKVKAMGSADSIQKFEGDLEVSHNLLRNKVKLAVDVDAKTIASARASLSLETPWEKLRIARAAATHEYQSRERCVTTLSGEFNDLRGELRHEQNIRSGAEFDGKTRLEYGRAQVITLDHRVSLANSRNGQITASLATPFSEARTVDLTMTVNGPIDNFRSTIEIMLNRRERINGNVVFQVNPQRGTTKVSTGLTTPYQSLRNLQIDYDQSGSAFDHQGPEWASDMELTVQLNDKRWWNKRTLSMDRDGAFRMNVKSQSPESTRPTEFNLEHTPKDGRNGETGWSNKAWMEVEGTRYTGESAYVWRGTQQLNAKVIIKLPQEEYNLILNHTDTNGQVSTELTGKGGRHGSGTLSFSMNPQANRIQLTANIQTPYRNYEKFDLLLKHNGPSNSFKTTARLTTSLPEYQHFNAELTHNGAPDNFNCQIRMKTPFQSMPNVAIRISHKMTRTGLEGSIQVEYSDKKISTNLNYNNDGRIISLNAHLETPYRGYESFAVEFQHSGNSWRSFQSNAKLNTPFSKLPELRLGFEFNVPRAEEVKTKIQIRLPSGERSATYTHNMNNVGNLNVTLEVTTPYAGYETSRLYIEHLTNNRSPKTKVSLSSRDIVINGERSGDMSDLTLKGDFRKMGRNPAHGALNWRHTAVQGGIDIRSNVTTSAPGYDSFNLAIKHQPSGRGFKSTGKLETSIRNYEKFGYDVDHTGDGRGNKINVKIETPYRGYDKWEGNVEYSSPYGNAEQFTISAQITTPIDGYRNFGFTINHSGQASRFQTSGRITTPFRQASEIDYTIKHRGNSVEDFSTGVDIVYSGKRIELDGTFKLNEPNGYDSDYTGSLKIKTPCPYLRNFDVTASHNRKPQLKSGALIVNFNGDKKVDFEYSYATGGTRNIVITLRDPYQMATNVRLGDTTGTATVDWDTTDRDKQVRFDFGFKDIKTETSTERLLSFKTSIPNSRTVGFLFGYSCSPGKFSHNGELYWDRDSASDFAYKIEGTKAGRGYMTNYDGNLKVTSALINIDTRVSHKSQPGRKHETELSISGQSTRLTLKSDLTVSGDTDFIHTLTIQHPRLTQDLSVVTEVRNGNNFKMTLNFDRQSATLEGSFTNESRGQSSRYSSVLHLQHPNSMTDIKLTGLVYADPQKLGGSLESQYKTTRDREIKTATLKTEIDRKRREISAELMTPLENFKLRTSNRGGDSYEEGVYRYDVIASVGRNEYKYSADVSTKDRSYDVKLYDNNDYIQIFAQFFSPLQSQIDISRTLQGRKHNDIQISLSMNEERVIKGRAYIRPQIIQDISSYFQTLDRYPPAIVRSLSQSSDRLSRAIDDEWQLKKRMLEDSLSNIRQVVESIVRDIQQKISEIRSEFNAAYYRNDFYMKDIHQALQRHYDNLSRHMSQKMSELRRKWYDFSKQANQVVSDKWNEISDSVSRKSAEIKYHINRSVQNTGRYFDDMSRDIRKKAMEHIHRMENHPFYRDYSLIKPSDLLLPPEQWPNKVKANFWRVLARLEADLDQFIARNRPQIEQLKQKLLRYLQEKQEWFRKLGMEDQLRDYMYKMHTMTWPQVKALLKQSLSEHFQWQRTKWTVWDPQRGEYAFEAYVPVDIPDLSTIQKVTSMDILATPRSLLPDISLPSDWSLMDLVYAYRPVSDVRDWVPPFKAHATVSGNQHYMTFDRKFYEFAGECSYLLARDFIGKTFSVVVNYERTGGMPAKKSISVLTEGKQLEITTEGKLTVDGRRTEMPVRYGNTTVSRQGNTIVVNNRLGLEVVCDLPHDHCTVAVSGWYYGKTAGLMGTYDNEAFNDFMSTDKSIRETPEEMAESWTVGARCRPTNFARTVTPDKSTRRYRACSELFEDDSSIMRPCFKRVPPQQFMEMCLNDVPMNDNSLEAQQDVCRAAAAYRHECRRYEIHIRMPSTCVQCQVPMTREKFYEGEMKTLKQNTVPKSADVVFVIQHGQCNRELVSKVRESIDDMVKAFTATGLREVRYAVVGFGGSEHATGPHVHTMDGQIFAEGSQLSSAIYLFTTVGAESNAQPDAMGALAYAAKLPFRAGVSKSIILMPCDSCQELTVRYSDIQRVLLQSDIRLHVLAPQPIRLKTRSPKTSLIFGVDDETVYTSKDVSDDELSGESDLRKYVRLPKDLCVALTHETSGTVFSSSQWTQSHGSLQKKFTDVFSRMVAQKAEPTDCQKCECSVDATGSGVAHCSSCYQKPIFNLLPNFNNGDYSDDVADERMRATDDDDDDDDERPTRPRDNSDSARPSRNRGDRVRRPKKTRVEATPPRPQRIPSRPEVKDQ